MAYMRPAITRIAKQKKKMEERAGKLIIRYPAYLYTLFYAFGLYLVLPLIDVPLLGLSISAPIFFVIAATVIFKPVKPWFKEHQGWIILSLSIWLAVALSTIINEMLPGGSFNRSGMISILQYAYWLLVFVVCGYLFRDGEVRKRTIDVFAFGSLVLGILRWVEALIFGRIGAWSGTQIMTQNGYGFQFSAFYPFLIYKVFNLSTRKKGWWILGTVMTLGAIAINGSRGSWVAIAIGFSLMVFLFFLYSPRSTFYGLSILLVLTILGGLVLSVSPELNLAVSSRIDSMTSLDEDKSYVVRKVLVQKGLKLFEESPIIGVGSLRFTEEKTNLELPELLSHANIEIIERKQSHNSYIQFLAEFGLLGSIPFLLLLLGLLLQLYGLRKRVIQSGELQIVAIFISFVQMLTHIWVINALTSTMFWAMLGLVAGAGKEDVQVK